MKQRIRTYITPSFFVFLALAAFFWYGNKLENRYTTDVELPVNIENDYTSQVWVEQPRLVVNARVEGFGARILSYRFGQGDRLTVPMSQLQLEPVADRDEYFTVDKRSLVAAVNAKASDMRMLQVLDTAILLRVSPVETRRMPLESRIEVNTARQYMQVGEVRFRPDSVDVKGPKLLLDSIRAIPTRRKTYRDLKGTVTSRIDLEQIDRLVLSERQVDYIVEVVPFTQQTFGLPIQVKNGPADGEYLTLPDKVDVTFNIPLRNYEQLNPDKLFVSVDYGDINNNTSGKTAVWMDSLPIGVELLRMEPQFIEVYRVANPDYPYSR